MKQTQRNKLKRRENEVLDGTFIFIQKTATIIHIQTCKRIFCVKMEIKLQIYAVVPYVRKGRDLFVFRFENTSVNLLAFLAL